jgi:hypothetical protein
MELNLISSYLTLFQEQVNLPFNLFITFSRDSDFAKQATEAFKLLEKKYSKKISVTALNSKLVEDHMLPMMVVQDKSSGEIVS